MTIDKEIKKLEKELKYCQECVIKYAEGYNRFRRLPILNKYYLNMNNEWVTRMNKTFRKLREIMQKEYPERFIGVNN